MATITTFRDVLKIYREESFSQRDKGDRFERLIQAYFKTNPQYSILLKDVWMWNEFPFKDDFGGNDTGIDLVAETYEGAYWAIQCKCYDENAYIDKKELDSFLSTSSKTFCNENQEVVSFSNRFWVSTSYNWSSTAGETIKNQNPPVSRINLTDLEQASVDWGKLQEGLTGDAARVAKKSLRAHQKEALNNTHNHFKENDRGKLIMACGTGKTYTSLKIVENETKGNGMVLFLVPSIALLGQTLREWTADAEYPIYPIAICSDSGITKKRSKNDDVTFSSVVDLALPASTDVKKIAKQFKEHLHRQSQEKGTIVVFSTYQSIDVIAKAQKELLIQNIKAEFDLTICDEAHRTTGVALSKQDESAFTKVHDNEIIKSKKRLYMTATPRLFDDNSKSKAAMNDAVLCSMDDKDLYGEEIYRIGFGKAVEEDLLTDYKVLILTMSEKDVPVSVQNMISDENSEITSDDASKLIGCINAMSKQVLGDEGLIKSSDPEPMKRAVAFCQKISASQEITKNFNDTTELYRDSELVEDKEKIVSVSSKHIDGSMNAPQRDELLGWLKSDDRDSENECRVLTNVRCLSEGVDVPSLDAVLFLSARNSQVDVVQSVGRVMRRAPGKKYGYIVIPVVVPYDIEPAKALDDNDRYKVVWTVLNALRAHDDRFNATINKIDLNKKKPKQILVGGASHGSDDEILDNPNANNEINKQLAIQFQELQGVMYAKMVKKVGDRVYWEKWAKDVAKIAEDQIGRINFLIEEDEVHKRAFSKFLLGLQKNINPSISKDQAIEMLSQHIITKPVFEALFEGYSFVDNNAVSKAMQSMMNILESSRIEKDTKVLDAFYQSVKKRASGIDNAEGKQRIIIELYDKFFKTAFPKMVEQLGIVYTPVEVVDFIIHSVNDVLKNEFNRTVSDENVHILDPFTGTGTFITRLLQSGLIQQKDLERKYTKELHANEIVLLAYYIAAVNIENAYHDATEDPDDGIGKEKFTPFDGIVLTDTFQLAETEGSDKLFSEMFPQNSERVQRQKDAPIQVIIGNPPYSVGQKSENDDAKNQAYTKLDLRITETYAKESKSTSVRSLFDPYFRAFRWASDRLHEDGGIIAFITNSGWVHKTTYDGFRKSIAKEFSSIYVIDLKGAVKGKSGEIAKREGGNVFDIMTGVAITLLVKKKSDYKNCDIKYYCVDDYLNKKEKLKFINEKKSVLNDLVVNLNVIPNKEGDWLEQRSKIFPFMLPLAPSKKFNLKDSSFFVVNSLGVNTNRDSWVCNFSSKTLKIKVNETIAFYNNQVLNFQEEISKNKKISAQQFIDKDSKKISWSSSLIPLVEKGIGIKYENELVFNSMYRPFFSQKLYMGEKLIHRRGQSELIFPSPELNNKVICVTGKGDRRGFATIMTKKVPDIQIIENSQYFPLYYYEKNENKQSTLFDANTEDEYIRRDGVSDFILKRAIEQYGKSVSKEDIFYYVYGVLHSLEYRETFANDLKKMLPRIPLVEKVKDFWAFSKAGRTLAELHINYETVESYKGVVTLFDTIPQEEIENGLTGKKLEAINYQVQKMAFGKKKEEIEGKLKTVADKSTIIFNSQITVSNIPSIAYEYVVNGKSAIEWIMERYQIKTDKKSGITNNPNDWSDEVGNPKYILDLLLSIINVSVQTVAIVNNLPKLKFE